MRDKQIDGEPKALATMEIPGDAKLPVFVSLAPSLIPTDSDGYTSPLSLKNWIENTAAL